MTTSATPRPSESAVPASRRVARLIAVSAAVAVTAVAFVEVAASMTRASHNRHVRHLNAELSLSVTGSGDAVVFIHGFRGSGRYWEPHVRGLVPRHRVVVVDLLGFGNSPWPRDARYDVATHLVALDRVISPATGNRKMTIVGHSMGAILAAEYARAHPATVSHLILVNAPMFRSEKEAREKIRAMSPMAEMFSVRRSWARASCDLVCAFRPLLVRIAPRIEPDVPAHVARDAVLHRWESFDRTLQHVVLRSTLERTLRALPRSIRVTIIHGADDRVTSPQRLTAIANEIGATLRYTPGGHNLYLINPRAVLDEVERSPAQRVR